MKPKNMREHLGIELEVISPLNIEKTKELVNRLRLEKFIDVGYDASIRVPSVPLHIKVQIDNLNLLSPVESERLKRKYVRYGIELRLLVEQSKYKTILPRVKKLLDLMNAKVNNSCGMHVHIDVRNRPVATTLFKLFRDQPKFFKGVNAKRAVNKFCRPVTRKFLEQFINRRTYPETKYKAINVMSIREHNTVEVRAFAGTVAIKTIIHNIELVLNAIK